MFHAAQFGADGRIEIPFVQAAKSEIGRHRTLHRHLGEALPPHSLAVVGDVVRPCDGRGSGPSGSARASDLYQVSGEDSRRPIPMAHLTDPVPGRPQDGYSWISPRRRRSSNSASPWMCWSPSRPASQYRSSMRCWPVGCYRVEYRTAGVAFRSAVRLCGAAIGRAVTSRLPQRPLPWTTRRMRLQNRSGRTVPRWRARDCGSPEAAAIAHCSSGLPAE